MSDIVDFDAKKKEREAKANGPDEGLIEHDRFGNEMYYFQIEFRYPMNGIKERDIGTHCIEILAYDFADAEARFNAIKTGQVTGQILHKE